jgi:hypothetical protein
MAPCPGDLPTGLSCAAPAPIYGPEPPMTIASAPTAACPPRTLERRLSIAPMMDWTDGRRFSRLEGYLPHQRHT